MAVLNETDRISPPAGGTSPSGRRPRVGLYLPDYRPSGPLRYVEAIAAEADRDEFDIVYVCDSGQVAADEQGRPCPTGIQRHCGSSDAETSTPRSRVRDAARAITPRCLRIWAGFARTSRRMAREFRQPPLDLLHTQNTGCEESAVAARWAGVPRVLGTFHVDSTYDLDRLRSGPTHRTLETISNHCLHRAIAVSQATADDWTARSWLPGSRVTTIHNGIDPEHFQRQQSLVAARRQLGLSADGALIIGGVGRLEAAKGFGHLVEAVAALRAAGRNVRLVLAGDGVLRSNLAEQAQRLGIGEALHLVGFQSDPRVVYDAIDLLAMPSLCEALPFALLEAMAHQLPVVASSVGGIPEVVIEGETGFLVAPRQGARLAAALSRLVDSPELRLRLGAAGRARVERQFQQQDMARKTLDVYRSLLSRPARVRSAGRKTRTAEADVR